MAAVKTRSVESLGPRRPAMAHARWARVFKALGHPTRLFIFDRVSHHSESVSELSAMVGDDPSTLSRHLHVLTEVGLVQCREEGTYRYYSARPGCVRQLVGCIRAMENESAGLPGVGGPQFDELSDER